MTNLEQFKLLCGTVDRLAKLISHVVPYTPDLNRAQQKALRKVIDNIEHALSELKYLEEVSKRG